MKWWCSNIGKGDNLFLDSVDIGKTYYLLSQTHLLQPCSRYIYFFPSDLHPTTPPHLSPFGANSLLSVAPAFTSQLDPVWIVCPHRRHPHPPASTTFSCSYLPCRPWPDSQVLTALWSPTPRACVWCVHHLLPPPLSPSSCYQVTVSP